MKRATPSQSGGEPEPPASAPAPPSPSSPIHLRRLLVPTDFSEASRAALALATELAERFGAQIDLTYVIPPALPIDVGHPVTAAMPVDDLERRAAASLARFREAHLPKALPVVTHVLTGAVAYELTEFAARRNTDLLVISTHGHTGLKHLLMGSTAEQVLRHAPCPVLVARAAGRKRREFRLRQILVPTDFSAPSTKALHYALALAEQAGATLSLVHVLALPSWPEFGYARMAIKSAQGRRTAQERLQTLRAGLGDRGDRVGAWRVRSGNPFREIIAEAEESRADLIVVATHGHTGLAHFLLGGTTEKIVRHAGCPVLVVRQRERDFVEA
ncbi:MAG TPA: universal stress protein [Methylomirabilota bacterium]|nr:universal stress protein [Methylomirabilota bacterium]